jgi:phenylpropionate dioxygenase-like ring-hydroxylating dioxygenase large terminal subunit
VRPLPKVATSHARPHWVLLGFQDRLARRVSNVTLHDTKLVVFPTKDGDKELRVAHDACPHRGASLGSGGVVQGDCMVCPYHSRRIGVNAYPERFFDYSAQDGLVWVDFASNLLTQHHPPPAYPEHSDPALRTFEYSKELAVNPVLMAENTLDWQHLSSVHRVHFIQGEPKVTIRSRGAHGWAEYAYQSGLFELTIDNEYHIPFTTSLRFRFRHMETGEELPPLLLWFSISPVSGGKVALHLRVSRGALTSPLADWIFRLIDELPLLEDAAVVAGVDPLEWSRNRLDAGDEFVSAYREAMKAAFPEILEWYVT